MAAEVGLPKELEYQKPFVVEDEKVSHADRFERGVKWRTYRGRIGRSSP